MMCLIELGGIMKKMSDWFNLPVECTHIVDDAGAKWSSDSIAIDGNVILTDHHVDKVEIAINSYDNHIELLRQCIPHLQFNDPELLAKVKEAVE